MPPGLTMRSTCADDSCEGQRIFRQLDQARAGSDCLEVADSVELCLTFCWWPVSYLLDAANVTCWALRISMLCLHVSMLAVLQDF